VNELDARIFDLLDAYTPEPRRWPDWRDVLIRTRKRHVRRLVVAVAAAIGVLACAAAVAAALGGFHAWLSGSPGKPAPKAEQELFEQANEHSVAAFPKGTKLRELIRRNVDGKVYVLFGFRSGSSLCLRLKAVSLGHSFGPTCAPASRLVHAVAPILPVVGVGGFSDKRNHPSAAISYGIAADGVSRVVVHAIDGDHPAALGGNAYLWVQNEPNTGQHALSVTAIGPNGRRITLPILPSAGMFATETPVVRKPRGPTRVQRRILRPTIAWYLRGEKRGVGLNEVRGVVTYGQGPLDDSTRLVKPDPASNVLVGLAGQWCIVLVTNAGGPGTGCDSPQGFWSHGPMNVISTSEGDQFVRFSGAAADGVRRIVVLLANGQRQEAALRDNLFTVLVASAEFPARLVAYDAAGRIVGIETPPWFLPHPIPKAANRLRPILRVRGPEGVVAVARVGRRVRGYQCWRVDLSTGQSPGACLPPIGGGPSLWVDLVQPAGGDLFIIGHTRSPIARVQLEFSNGDVVRTRPIDGLFVLAVPRAHLRPERQAAFVRGYTNDGRRVQRQGVVFKLRR
jgi:hypothetical protein